MERSIVMIQKLSINDTLLTYTVIENANSFTITATDEEKNTQIITVERYCYDEITDTISLFTESQVHRFIIDNSQNIKNNKPITLIPSNAIQNYIINFFTQSAINKNSLSSATNSILFTPSKLSNEHFVTSPLSGRTSKLMITIGQRVKKGQVLVLIESMKMENEICSTVSAVIKTILIAEGDVVQLNEFLVELENEGDRDVAIQDTHVSQAI